MKKKFLCLFMALFMLTACNALVGCDGLFGDPADPPLPNFNEDIQSVQGSDINTEHFVVEEEVDYYTSPGFSLYISVKGAFLSVDYFSLDGNKRVYDNLYFYKNDYFYIVTSDVKYLYAGLGDSNDTEYAEEEKEQGEEVQINIKKEGIYKLIFDIDTLKFDMVYKSEITTPVYYTIKKCSIFTLATDWVEMSVNPDNADEFCIKNFTVALGKTISFFDNIHTSNYIVTLDDSCDGKYGVAYKSMVYMNMGGSYDIYINKKTYVVRIVLREPDTATYGCIYYDGEFHTLQPAETDIPYIFHQNFVAEETFVSVPDFYTINYLGYDLTIEESPLLVNGYFKNPGSYKIIVNLKTFTISVEQLPQ